MMLIDFGIIAGSFGFNYYKTQVFKNEDKMDNNHKLIIGAAILLIIIFVVAILST
jgi:hypothetical protein